MDYLTTSKAADALGISVEGVRALIRRGQLRAEKTGRDLLIHRDAVERAKGRPKPGRPTEKKPTKRRAK